jgi:hypothetical protein
LEKYGTPRQGLLAAHALGKIILRPDLELSCVEGLEQFSHVFHYFCSSALNSSSFGFSLSSIRMMDRKRQDGSSRAKSSHQSSMEKSLGSLRLVLRIG